jgi:AcrR family transcriptional regulator
VSEPARAPSPRQGELLELAYRYALQHGLADLSLRPLAGAIGSSPRVLLFLFGSKEGLLRALLARARTDELALLDRISHEGRTRDLADIARMTWGWLAAGEHRPLLVLWAEAYARSLTEPDGPWAGFARQTVEDWLALLATGQPADRRRTAAGAAERSLALAVLRGSLLDLLATNDLDRTTAAVHRHLAGRP